MKTTTKILSLKSHRDYDYPQQSWMYYQEWNRVLFLHYQVPVELLHDLIPKELTIDSFEGTAYISIVPFTMENIRPRFLPSLDFVSNFGEINVRTYVVKDGRRGVYFLNIEAEKYLSAFLSKKLSGLPYEKSNIKITGSKYISQNINKGFFLDTEYTIGEKIQNKTALDLWLTERYCLYVDNKDSLFRYEIHHEEWDLNTVQLKKLDLNYEIGKLKVTESTDLVHYSKGVKVLAWNKVKV